jgi:hypothetical protein
MSRARPHDECEPTTMPHDEGEPTMMPHDEGKLTMMNDNDGEPTRMRHDEGEPGWSVMRTTLAKFKTTINLTDGSRGGEN